MVVLRLAAYVTFDALHSLATGEPDHSPIGITLAALSHVIMPARPCAERRTGRGLGSISVVADSKQALLCAYLSGVLLAGLVLDRRSAGTEQTRSPSSPPPP
jgi:divalent metal cation (Fe/Co/Zn/Cd) transporter